MFRLAILTISAVLGAIACLSAHDGLSLARPLSDSEAWNVIELCHANMESLTAEERWTEVGIQAALGNQAWRYLREGVKFDPAGEPRRQKVRQIEEVGSSLIKAISTRRVDETKALLRLYAGRLQELEGAYDPAVVKAKVYGCPMCRGIRELDPNARCPNCGMKLEERMIPASDAYNTPGEPSIVITPTVAAPLVAGRASDVKIRLTRKKDGVPVTLDDLRVVHTEPIHLLIIDESLRDYHHEHPRPTGVPGEYTFHFTPGKSGSYRVFADLVPRLSRVQEYAVCDLPGESPGESFADHAVTTLGQTGDLRCELHWAGDPAKLRVMEPVAAVAEVTDAAGQPFSQLEPVMGAYAHIVGFYEDRQTVLHIHPEGLEPQGQTERGGPDFKFRFYAPKPGFIRLYVQVQVAGGQRFVPFGVAVSP